MIEAPERLLTYEERRALRRRLRGGLAVFLVGLALLVFRLQIKPSQEPMRDFGTSAMMMIGGLGLYAVRPSGPRAANLAAERKRAAFDVLLYLVGIVLLGWMTGLIDHLRRIV